MEAFRDLSIVWSLFHILILFMVLYRSRYSRRKTFLLTGVFMGLLIVLNVAGLVNLGAELMGKIFILTCTLPSLLFFWLVSKDKKGRFFFTFCLADTVAYWIIAVTNVLDFYIGGGQCILMLIGRLVLFPLAEWAAARYLRKPYLELQDSVAEGWGIFAGVTALYYMLLAVSGNFPVIITKRPQEFPTFVMILALMPVTYATIFAALYRQLLLYRRRQRERILQEQKNVLEAQLENQQRIRKMRHDMKGHTATLSGLLAAGNTKEAQAYLKNMEEGMDSLAGQFCGNPYINAVLSHYSGKLERLGARCRMEIQVGMEQLPYMELCQILSNGLENACEALCRLDMEKREASVQMKYHRNYLLIRIRNRCREGLCVERGRIPATDKNGRGHGFGLATVQEAARLMDGEMVCYTECGNFVLDVMVPCQSFSKRMAGEVKNMKNNEIAIASLEARINIGIRRAVCELDPEKAIGIILEFLGKELKGERSYIFERNASGGDDNTYEWTAPGVTREKDKLQNLPPEICKNWYRYFEEDKNIMFDDIEKMRYDDPLQYENLKSQNIRSIVIVPLYDNNQVIGFYGIDNPPKQDLELALSMLQIVGYFISATLKRRDYMNQLRAMSFSDQLTNLGNRYAMNEYILKIEGCKRLGIVYCDITGLKRTNDTLGHKMGDALICRAAESLRSAFEGYGLFRIGGDELLAICVGVDKEELESHIALLRKKAAGNSVNLAIGWVWKEQYENDMQKLISEAENLMYKEKSEYYRTSGIERRR